MKFIVTNSATWIDGKKYRRGDILELASGDGYAGIAEHHEVEKPKGVRRTRKKAEPKE